MPPKKKTTAAKKGKGKHPLNHLLEEEVAPVVEIQAPVPEPVVPAEEPEFEFEVEAPL